MSLYKVGPRYSDMINKECPNVTFKLLVGARGAQAPWKGMQKTAMKTSAEARLAM